jgi:hypothetical protein
MAHQTTFGWAGARHIGRACATLRADLLAGQDDTYRSVQLVAAFSSRLAAEVKAPKISANGGNSGGGVDGQLPAPRPDEPPPELCPVRVTVSRLSMRSGRGRT